METQISPRFEDLPASGFIRLAQLIPAVLPWSAATHWRRVKEGDFPRPVKLGPQITAWRVLDVREWLAARAGSRS